jgi:hypothetical protein
VSWLLSQAAEGGGSFPDLVHWLPTAGATGVLAFLVVALMRGWLVPGPTHDRVVVERNRLLELALTSTRAADRAVTIAHEDRELARRIAGTSETPG